MDVEAIIVEENFDSKNHHKNHNTSPNCQKHKKKAHNFSSTIWNSWQKKFQTFFKIKHKDLNCFSPKLKKWAFEKQNKILPTK